MEALLSPLKELVGVLCGKTLLEYPDEGIRWAVHSFNMDDAIVFYLGDVSVVFPPFGWFGEDGIIQAWFWPDLLSVGVGCHWFGLVLVFVLDGETFLLEDLKYCILRDIP